MLNDACDSHIFVSNAIEFFGFVTNGEWNSFLLLQEINFNFSLHLTSSAHVPCIMARNSLQDKLF